MRAGRYLNKKNLSILAKENKVWSDIEEDIKEIEIYLGEEVAPLTKEEKKHLKTAQLKCTVWTNL